MAMLVTQPLRRGADLMFLEWMARGKASILGVIRAVAAAITLTSGFVGVLAAS